MNNTIAAHVYEKPYPGKGWDALEWNGSAAFITPVAWNRFYQFIGQKMTVIIMSDDWMLSREDALEIAVEIANGKRSYYSIPLNEDNPTWRKVW